MNTFSLKGKLVGTRVETTPSGFELKSLRIAADKKKKEEVVSATYEMKVFNGGLFDWLVLQPVGVDLWVSGAIDSNVSQDGRVFTGLIANEIAVCRASTVSDYQAPQRPAGLQPKTSTTAQAFLAGNARQLPQQPGSFNIPKQQNPKALPVQFEDDDIPF